MTEALQPANCKFCLNQYEGDNGVMYCRPHNGQWGLECSPEAADGCTRYEPKPVTADRVWFDDGRGC